MINENFNETNETNEQIKTANKCIFYGVIALFGVVVVYAITIIILFCF